jgi:hypothetical protein
MLYFVENYEKNPYCQVLLIPGKNFQPDLAKTTQLLENVNFKLV